MFYFESISINSFYVILFIILFILLYYYYKKIKLIDRKYRILLISLRILSIIILSILLLEPIFIQENEYDRMKLSFLIDNSKSMNTWKNIDNIKSSISRFEMTNKNKINTDYYIFGDSLRYLNSLNEINFNDNSTNFYNLFSNLNNINSDEFILISDGKQTSGFYYNNTFPNYKVINTWGVGENRNSEDISILDCRVDTILNNHLLLDVKIQSNSIDNTYIDVVLVNELNNKKIHSLITQKGNSIKNYKINIKKEYLSNNNIIIVNSNINDNDLNNNYFKLSLNSRMLKVHNFLMLSGNLSSNTRKIKNMFNDNNNIIDHYYRLNDSKFNKNISDISLNKYDLIILDNFPLINEDFLFLNSNNIFDDNFVYFLGNINRENLFFVNKFLNEFEYEATIKDNVTENIISDLSLNHNADVLNLLKKVPKSKSSINVKSQNDNDNTIVYSNQNLFIDFNKDNLFVFSPDLSMLSNQALSINDIDIYKNILKYYINKVGNSDDIKIYSLKNIYDNNEECIVYFDNINGIKKLSLNVEDISTGYVVNYTKSELIDDVHNFNVNFDDVSDCNVQLSITLDNGLILKSNILNIKSILESSEITNIDFDKTTLKNIAINSNGRYVHINDIGDFFNSYIINVKNKIIKIRYNIFTFSKYWLILILSLLLEWYIRKKRGLL